MVLPNILVISPRKLLAIVFGDGIEKRKAKVLDKKLLEKVWELSKKIILCYSSFLVMLQVLKG